MTTETTTNSKTKRARIDRSTLIVQNLSNEEISRRQRMFREIMVRNNIPVAIISNSRDCFRSWLTGQNGTLVGGKNDGFVIVPTEGDILIGCPAPIGDDENNDDWRDKMGAVGIFPAIYPGVTAKFGFNPGDAVREIKQTGIRRLGVVNFNELSDDILGYIKSRVPEDIEWVDMTVDAQAVKMIKSGEEIEAITHVACMHEQVFAAVPALTRIDMLESELVNSIKDTFFHKGSGGNDRNSAVIMELISNPDDQPLSSDLLKYPGRRIAEGDRIDVRVHAIGDNEFYGMLSRSFVIGTACPDTLVLWETALAAQDIAAEALVPGATLNKAATEVNKFLSSNGYAEDGSNFLHCVEYSAQSLPCMWDPSADTPLVPGMIIAICPTVAREDIAPICCGDVYVVTESGGERLGKMSRDLITI